MCTGFASCSCRLIVLNALRQEVQKRNEKQEEQKHEEKNWS